jgi:hypothetical protein
VLLGLRAQLREDTGLSLAEAVFGRVQPDRGHQCGRRRVKRYDSTSLLRYTEHLICRDCTLCTRVLEYKAVVANRFDR